jgi:hypothetical protein
VCEPFREREKKKRINMSPHFGKKRRRRNYVMGKGWEARNDKKRREKKIMPYFQQGRTHTVV